MNRLDFDMNMLLKILNENIDKNAVVEVDKTSEAPKELVKPVEQARPKRCQNEGCKVKLMLADFACRCKQYYCSQHRASELHNCSFDYKAITKELLTKQMPAVVGEKFQRI